MGTSSAICAKRHNRQSSGDAPVSEMVAESAPALVVVGESDGGGLALLSTLVLGPRFSLVANAVVNPRSPRGSAKRRNVSCCLLQATRVTALASGWVLEVGNGSPYQIFSSLPHGGDLGLKIARNFSSCNLSGVNRDFQGKSRDFQLELAPKIFFVQLEWPPIRNHLAKKDFLRKNQF